MRCVTTCTPCLPGKGWGVGVTSTPLGEAGSFVPNQVSKKSRSSGRLGRYLLRQYSQKENNRRGRTGFRVLPTFYLDSCLGEERERADKSLGRRNLEPSVTHNPIPRPDPRHWVADWSPRSTRPSSLHLQGQFQAPRVRTWIFPCLIPHGLSRDLPNLTSILISSLPNSFPPVNR